jgi:hypothetical protein
VTSRWAQPVASTVQTVYLLRKFQTLAPSLCHIVTQHTPVSQRSQPRPMMRCHGSACTRAGLRRERSGHKPVKDGNVFFFAKKMLAPRSACN